MNDNQYQLELKRIEAWGAAVSAMARTCGKQHKEETYQEAKKLAETMKTYLVP